MKVAKGRVVVVGKRAAEKVGECKNGEGFCKGGRGSNVGPMRITCPPRLPACLRPAAASAALFFLYRLRDSAWRLTLSSSVYFLGGPRFLRVAGPSLRPLLASSRPQPAPITVFSRVDRKLEVVGRGGEDPSTEADAWESWRAGGVAGSMIRLAQSGPAGLGRSEACSTSRPASLTPVSSRTADCRRQEAAHMTASSHTPTTAFTARSPRPIVPLRQQAPSWLPVPAASSTSMAAVLGRRWTGRSATDGPVDGTPPARSDRSGRGGSLTVSLEAAIVQDVLGQGQRGTG